MYRPQGIIFGNYRNQMHMIWHNYISVNGYMQMWRYVLEDCVYNMTAGSQLDLGRFVNRPYDAG